MILFLGIWVCVTAPFLFFLIKNDTVPLKFRQQWVLFSRSGRSGSGMKNVDLKRFIRTLRISTMYRWRELRGSMVKYGRSTHGALYETTLLRYLTTRVLSLNNLSCRVVLNQHQSLSHEWDQYSICQILGGSWRIQFLNTTLPILLWGKSVKLLE